MEEAPKNKETIVAELISLRSMVYADEDKFVELVEFMDALKKKYGKEVNQYEVFHLFAGSGLREGHIPEHFDFSGEDSIENFVRRLING